jgi:hypothetical protein
MITKIRSLDWLRLFQFLAAIATIVRFIFEIFQELGRFD